MHAVLHSFSYCLDYFREQVTDVAPADMTAQPNGFLMHPAWVLGHLTYSCQALGVEIGLSPWLPAVWAANFGTGSVPFPDPKAYVDKAEGLAMLTDAQRRISTAVEQLTASQLDAPLPDERFRFVLPTIRHAITQVLIAHTANHVGQVTLWRRAMDLPTIKRPFV